MDQGLGPAQVRRIDLGRSTANNTDAFSTPSGPPVGTRLTNLSNRRPEREPMRTLPRRRHAAALILFVALLSPAITTTTAFAAGTGQVPAHAFQGGVFYATYPNHAACVAAGDADPAGRTYQCVVSTRPGAFDLYFSG
jgi:hypothetical protein